MAEPIKIIINKSQDGQGTAPQMPQEQAPERAEQGKTSPQMKAVNAAVINVAKTALIQGVHIMGDITGNYTATRMLDQTLSLGADAMTIAIGGPVGAIAVVGKYALQAGQSFASNYIQNREVDMQRMRVGNISVKGSRY
ncbi:MAG: hypothetical protein EOL92_07560 [Bacteroidia bacterium]|nr:hypothetical protein [Bacteroidia bacterium]